jgi:hypothetical protein
MNWNEEMKKDTVDTLKTLVKTWGIAVHVDFTDRTSNCYHRMDQATSKHKLVFGLPVMKIIYNKGVNDRCSSKLRGSNAIKALACHEYAHAVQTHLGFRYYGSCHNAKFYEIYYEMLQDILKP